MPGHSVCLNPPSPFVNHWPPTKDVAVFFGQGVSMKRLGLVPLTLLTVLLGGLALPAAGWFAAKSAPPRSTELRAAQLDDPASEADLRRRHGQPVHWRALLLHR